MRPGKSGRRKADNGMELTKNQKKMIARIAVAFVIYALAFILLKTEVIDEGNRLLCFVVFAVPYLIVGYDVLLAAAKNISRGQVFDEKFLMIIATFGAFAIMEFEETVMVMLLFQVGELFQSIAVNRSRKSIAAMMDIVPQTANLVTADGIETVDPDDVEVDAVIYVKAGEKVPLDGVVIEGETMVDTSALTGESVPRRAKPGDEILAGFINGNGAIKVRVTKEYDDTTVAKVLELVEDAGENKAETEAFITKFARYYTPAVVISALLLAVIPPIAGLRSLSASIRTACVFLVTSCPCALVISVPLSFFGGIGAAAKKGILIKGGNFMESAAKADTFVFDKTGTLTKGSFEVTKVICEQGVDELSVVECAATAEAYSTHPIALSIIEYGKKLGIASRTDGSAEEIPGHGMRLETRTGDVLAGNYKLMKKYGIKIAECNENGSVVYVAKDGEAMGVIVVSDAVKEDSAAAVAGLKTLGVRNTVMLSGDRKNTAEAVAKSIGLDEVHAELLPDEKAEGLRKILGRKKTHGGTEDGMVCYVGDGINDAPALAMCDVGIAMGSLGSDAAIEAADIVLMDDKPSKLCDVVKISRKTDGIVRQNIAGSLAVKFAVLALGVAGIATMWLAIVADVGVMVAAVLNASRTLKF